MEERNLRKVMIGTVTSDKMDKTVVVSVETSVSHSIYSKTMKTTYKLKATDPAFAHLSYSLSFLKMRAEIKQRRKEYAN